MRQVPSGASGCARLEFLDLLLDAKIPGNVGRQIADARKRAHRLDGDGLVGRQRVHARHAHELRHAVDFRRAGAAFAGLAIPAAGEVVGLRRLDFVDDVEHHQALGDLGGVIHELAAAVVVRAPDSESDCFHRVNVQFFISSMTCFNSSRHRRNRFAPQFHGTVRRLGNDGIVFGASGSLSGKSSRKWPPRLSLRSSAEQRDGLGNGQQMLQVNGRVPAGVVFAMAMHGDFAPRAS